MTTAYRVAYTTLDAYAIRVEGLVALGCLAQPYLDLTAEFFASLVPPGEPLAPGSDWFVRLKAEDPVTRAAINLNPGSAALVTLAVKPDEDSPAVVLRRSDAVLGSGFQIELDVQTVDNGPGGTTGRGWFKVRFARADQDQLVRLIGRRPYEIRIHFNAGDSRLFAWGWIDILKGRTYPVP